MAGKEGRIQDLKEFNFTNFKTKSLDPKPEHVEEIMKLVPRYSANYDYFKDKLDRELSFDQEIDKGIYYQTLVRYLALALGEI
jgi:hypothetical protein